MQSLNSGFSFSATYFKPLTLMLAAAVCSGSVQSHRFSAKGDGHDLRTKLATVIQCLCPQFAFDQTFPKSSFQHFTIR
jgi:hypothetical protein